MSLAHVEPTWRADAACQGATAVHFYPPSATEGREERRARENAARALCARCPVREACLAYALYVQEPYGIWGGTTEIERRKMLRRPEDVQAVRRPEDVRVVGRAEPVLVGR